MHLRLLVICMHLGSFFELNSAKAWVKYCLAGHLWQEKGPIGEVSGQLLGRNLSNQKLRNYPRTFVIIGKHFSNLYFR